ncbi:uncharacterized protein LOC127786764 [Diospyros lotus]|uniref:uncharacterized protein LOC127786764 n=1 Tax=Diospyros lotus TaxID=55363 RepID=UPI0022504CBE|nr:uncharacterized protein LOC127786764 [Diospyros lotus]
MGSSVVEMQALAHNSGNGRSQEEIKTSIYKVLPLILNNKEKAYHYQPRVVSFGPYHYKKPQEPHLRSMEAQKQHALQRFIRRLKRSKEDLLRSVRAVAEKLKGSYDSLDTKWEGDGTEDFVELMVLDGCFMLEILQSSYKSDYDPVFSEHGDVYVLPLIRHDMLLLENQLPMLLLHRLNDIDNDIENDDETNIKIEALNKDILNFLFFCNEEYPMMDGYLHVLDLFRGALLQGKESLNQEERKELPWKRFSDWMRNKPESISENNEKMVLKNQKTIPKNKKRPVSENNGNIIPKNKKSGHNVVRPATELLNVGVHFKRSKSNSLLDITFDDNNGILTLPNFVVDGYTESMFLNLLAFERCHICATSDITSFIAFMDCIIDSSGDIELLSSKGIIDKCIGTDKEAADLFNTMSKDLIIWNDNLYEVYGKLVVYNNTTLSKWRANLFRTYSKSPAAIIISVLAFFLLFYLTLLQTVFTIINMSSSSSSSDSENSSTSSSSEGSHTELSSPPHGPLRRPGKLRRPERVSPHPTSESHALAAGLRFPLATPVVEVFAIVGLCPSQLTPNGWRCLSTFILCCRARDIEPTAQLFFRMFKVISISKTESRFAFSPLNQRQFIVDNPTSVKRWKSRFFFAGLKDRGVSFGVPVEWAFQPSKVRSRKITQDELHNIQILRELNPITARVLICDRTLYLGGLSTHTCFEPDVTLAEMVSTAFIWGKNKRRPVEDEGAPALMGGKAALNAPPAEEGEPSRAKRKRTSHPPRELMPAPESPPHSPDHVPDWGVKASDLSRNTQVARRMIHHFATPADRQVLAEQSSEAIEAVLCKYLAQERDESLESLRKDLDELSSQRQVSDLRIQELEAELSRTSSKLSRANSVIRQYERKYAEPIKLPEVEEFLQKNLQDAWTKGFQAHATEVLRAHPDLDMSNVRSVAEIVARMEDSEMAGDDDTPPDV